MYYCEFCVHDLSTRIVRWISTPLCNTPEQAAFLASAMIEKHKGKVSKVNTVNWNTKETKTVWDNWDMVK